LAETIPQPRFLDVYSFPSLLAAFHRARRAKRGKGQEPAFYLDLEGNLLRLSDELRTRAYRPDPYRYFTLRTTKERVVSEASFRDRIVHHSLVAALEPVFEDRFIETSYACRKGKGTDAALARAQEEARRCHYFLKLDVSKYFDSIRHDVLLELLSQEIEDEGILWLCGVLMRQACVPGVDPDEHRGLPIGNLTSQFWANVYLDPVDHLVVGLPGVHAYLRYMDDQLLFGDDKEALWAAEEFIRTYAADRLCLTIKDRATVLAPVSEGMPWLGFRVYPGLVRLAQPSKVRFMRKLQTSVDQAAASVLADEGEVSRSASLCGHVAHANTRSLRRSILARPRPSCPGGKNGR
jgi:hypothetical protein